MTHARPPHEPLDRQALEALRAKMRGQVLTATDAEYDAVRTIHNGMIDHRPAAIARATGVADVLRALEFGLRHSLTIGIRGGGHGLAGFAVPEGGLMIDLSGMSAVLVDPSAKVARAQGGATWGAFDHETQAFGLATTGGVVRTTGIAGLTLAGGHGLLMRRFGYACDNLQGVEVVTAGCDVVRAGDNLNTELFWALRGGGGNFGIVTSFEYRLHEVGPVLAGLVIFPFDSASRVLRLYDEFTAAAPDELGSLAVLATLPDGTKAVASLVCYSGSIEEGERILRPLRTAATPIADDVQVMPYIALQSIVESFNPRGLRNYWKTLYLNELTPAAIEVMTETYSRVPAPLSHLVVYTLGGAAARVPPERTAVSYREARHAVLGIGMWEDPKDDEKNVRWVREFVAAMEPYASPGFYPNYEGLTAPDRLIAAFRSEKYQRLAMIKNRYDPANVFRLNQNIQPAAV